MQYFTTIAVYFTTIAVLLTDLTKKCESERVSRMVGNLIRKLKEV